MAIRGMLVFILLAKAIPLVSVEPDPEDYRLPKFYNVLDYNVTLNLNHKLFTENGTEFSGEVGIRFTFINVTNVTNYIVLHSAHNLIKLNKIIFENVAVSTRRYSVNNVTDILTIYIGNGVDSSVKYHLVIKYTGNITTEDLFGLYKSSYVDGNGETKYLLTSQFGPTFTRRIFPCFDEPEFKAYFNFTVNFPTGLNVFFTTKAMNMVSNATIRMTTARFHQTEKIWTGSLALIVSDLTCTDTYVDQITLQVCSKDESASERNLALHVAPKFLANLNRFTNYNYNFILGKLDIVAVPDLFSDGSANLGVQIHRENQLLYDDVESSSKYKEEITMLIAHELAHQWFGILVTYKWYFETFMDEGIATYFEYYIVNEELPHYEVEKRFVPELLHPILALDGTDTTPLHLENITTPSEILSTYNSITYNKGASIIRMVRYFMSLENFRTGVQNFIKAHEYGNMDSEDLWTELNKTIKDSVSKMPANLSVVMQNWVREPGYPLVTVSLNGNNLTISQSRFSYYGLNNEVKWYIPISYTVSTNISKFQSTTPDFWLTPDSDFQGRFPPESDWLILNNQQIGYYRVNYDSNLWAKIKNALEKRRFDGIIDINRAQIVDDLFNLARADLLPYSSVLHTIRFLKNDTSYYTWKAATDGLNLILRMVGDYTNLGKAVVKDVMGLIDNFYNSVPVSKIKVDDHFYTIKQRLAATWACRLGHEKCVKDVVQLFKVYRTLGRRPPVDLRYPIYCNGLRYSEDDSDWYFMWEAYLNATQPSEQKNIRTSLACSRNTTLLKIYLQKTITKDSGIRPQDAEQIFSAVGSSATGVNVALDFLIENQESILEHYQTPGAAELILLGIADHLIDEEKTANFMNITRNGTLKEEFKEHSDKAEYLAVSTLIWLHKYSGDLATYYKIHDASDKLIVLYSIFIIIPITLIIICGYCCMSRKEQIVNCCLQVLIWCGNMHDELHHLGMNNQEPPNDIPLREM